jgi:hypothetical protein
MAGVKAGKFISGANATIRVNGVLVAFATDMQYRIEVKHASPHILGVYEAVEISPLSIEVTGSFSVIRYHKHVKEALDVTFAGNQSDANGVGTFGLNDVVAALGLPVGKYAADGRAYDSFDPSKMHKSMMFDIEVRTKTDEGECTTDLIKNRRLTSTDVKLTKRSLKVQTYTFKAIYAEDDTFVANSSGQGQLNQ